LYHIICLYYTVINSLAYNVVESTRSQNMVASVNLLRFALTKSGLN